MVLPLVNFNKFHAPIIDIIMIIIHDRHFAILSAVESMTTAEQIHWSASGRLNLLRRELELDIELSGAGGIILSALSALLTSRMSTLLLTR